MRDQFAFYKSFDDVYQDLNDKQKLEFISIILDVQFLRIKIDDVSPKDSLLKHIWNAQKHSLKKSINGYLESQKNSKIKSPYLGVYDDNISPLQTPSEGNHKEEQGEEEEQVKGEGKVEEEVKKSNGFKKPSISEIHSYILEKNFNVNAETFFNFYESNGWKVGKNKMKSWKASLATWNSKNKNEHQQAKQLSFKEQDRQRTDQIADAVLNKGFNPFDPANYQHQEEEYTDVQLTN